METNALIALLRQIGSNNGAVSSVVSLIGRIGVRGVVLLARGYLGPLADRAGKTPEETTSSRPTLVTASGEDTATATGANRIRSATGLQPTDLAVLGLALTKLVFEVGELSLHNPTLEPDGKLPVFELDENNRAPAMSIAHVAAATRLWRSFSAKKVEAANVVAAAPVETPRMRLYAARNDYYAAAPRYTYAAMQPMTASRASTRASIAPNRTAYGSRGTTMSSSTSASSRCGTCGGSSRPAPQPTPTYDPCARGLPAAPRAPEGCASCGCAGGCGCANKPAPTKTYDSSKCPTFAISCETKTALRDCVKTALCDFLRCVTDTLCPDGKFEMARFDSSQNPDAAKQLQNNLIDCVGQLACSFMHCLPEALCPPPCEPPPPVIDCVPCDYAVEVLR